MKSWTNKVLFFSSNSIFFILLTRSNFFHIHTGNGLEEVLENQARWKEGGEEKKQRKNKGNTETSARTERKKSSSPSSSSWWRWWWWYRRWWWGWQWGWWRWWSSVVDHQTPELERLYTIYTYLIYHIHYSWKFAPISTSVAPIASLYIHGYECFWLRWLPPSHPHELYDCSNDFTFIPYTSLTHVLTFTEESIPVVEIQPLIFFKISS